ncbi:hypothetical protein J7E96_16145 [Streptomyces sp. ISL-96]|uniref:DUF3592 domain-containing protein n=1 Tax=Streptomyces sp. ISL-96 TaxID=2819191 RepID=UPI001BE80172|nr:DUF3592 domain-containing protein [Streptomyces sp. ISL-96]MBT2490021.1 hypothetical protein [Streptomyces sp. ISL-96]
MDFMFYAVPALIAAVAVLMAAKTVVSLLRLREAWRSGLTAEARCLRTYTTTRSGGDSGSRTTLHHVYEFTVPGGAAPVRFEETNGPGTIVEGDIVPVHYPAGCPDRATAQPPSSAVRATAGAVFVVVFCAVMVAFCVFFAMSYATMSDLWSDF